MRLSSAVTAGIIILISSAAMGDLANPDFTGGSTDGWSFIEGYTTYEVIPNYSTSTDVLKLTATIDDTNYVSSIIAQTETGDVGGYHVPGNANRLWFYAAVEPNTPNWEAEIYVTWGTNSSTPGWDSETITISSTSPASDSSWQRWEVMLSDIDPTQYASIDITLSVWGNDVGSTSAAYFDNFQFVPEPTSILLTALGGLAVLRRKRKTT